MENFNKQNGYNAVYKDVIAHLEKKYPLISDKWKNGSDKNSPNLHIRPFALIQKGSYVLKDLFEAICKDEGPCITNSIFENNLDYSNFLIGKTRKITNTSDGPLVEYVKSEYLCTHANNPHHLLSYLQNAIVTITIQLPTLRSIKRFVKGVKSIFGDAFWRRIDQTKIPDKNGKYTLTLKMYNRSRFENESKTQDVPEETKQT
jgi:hypothetical protein